MFRLYSSICRGCNYCLSLKKGCWTRQPLITVEARASVNSCTQPEDTVESVLVIWGNIVYSLTDYEYNYYISYLLMLLSVISRQLLPPLVVITPSFVRPGTSLHVGDRYMQRSRNVITKYIHPTGIRYWELWVLAWQGRDYNVEIFLWFA